MKVKQTIYDLGVMLHDYKNREGSLKQDHFNTRTSIMANSTEQFRLQTQLDEVTKHITYAQERYRQC